MGIGDAKLLEKIQQFDDEDEHNMIFGKADERQWRAQCLRVEKKLSEITTHAKQAKRKSGHQHFDTAKISTSVKNDNNIRK